MSDGCAEAPFQLWRKSLWIFFSNIPLHDVINYYDAIYDSISK
jgi:hypothetical protein